MLGRAFLLLSFLALAVISNVLAYDGSISISIDKTGQAGYGEAASGSGQTSSDSLFMYQEYYDLGQGEQYASGPVQFNIYGSEPTYLIVDGQSRPYDPYYVPSNSLWIQGRSSWTQYIKCPLGARFKMLAYSNGGPTTMVETYPDGYQDVQQYGFYRGYTQLVFLADEAGRHTLVFYSNGQQSNEVVVDVVRSGGPMYGTGIASGQPSSSTVIISTGTGQGSGPQQGKSCNIAGTWKFGENTVVYYPDGKVESWNGQGELFDTGTWYVIDASKRLFGVTWQNGWRHTDALSADCSYMDATGVSNGRTETSRGTRVASATTSGIGAILIDSTDQGFDPNAPVQGYDDPYSQLPEIFIDSAEDGFDPTAVPQGEMI